MFKLYADKTNLTLRQRERLTSGSVNINTVKFEFSPDWDGLMRTAVFRAGGETVSVLLDDLGQCVIPWEVLSSHGQRISAGVYGANGGDVVLPTIWADLGTVLEGAAPGETARPPTPDIWEQELAGKADGMDLDGLTLRLLAGKRTLGEVELPSPGGGGGGASDHRFLTGRDAANQHPIDSIAGLADALNTIPRPMTADELRKILSGGTSYANK